MARKKLRGRSRMKNLKILHQCCRELLLTTIPLLLLCSSLVLSEPGYLDFDNLPETKFTCAGKVIGGYYADLETSCQMFHVCTIGQLDEPMDIKFLCLNGTVFDQETRVCERVDEVDCSKSEKFYYLNLELYGNTMVPMQDEEISVESMITVTTESFTSKMDKPPVEQISINRIRTTMNSNNIYTTTIAPQLPEKTQPLSQETKQTQSTGKPGMGHASSRIQPSYQLNQNNRQHNQYSFSSTNNPNGHINNSYQNSNKEEQQILENDEYEYDHEEDDPLSTAGYLSIQTRNHHDSGAQNLHKPPQLQPFSQHYIYQQQLLYNNNGFNNFNNNNNSSSTNHTNDGNNNNHDAGSGRTGYTNSAISFQQQQLQNSDPLPVTVTTHSVGYTNLVNNEPNPKEQQLNEYGYDSQIGSKQISLLPSSMHHQFQSPSEYPGVHLLPPLRLRGHGFQFSQQYPSQTLNGYGKSSPQIPLHLPYEHNRSQNQLLGFENDSADDLLNVQKKKKDLKRSDTLVIQSPLDLQVPTTTASSLNVTETKISSNENTMNHHQLTSRNSNIKNNYNYHDIKQIDNFRNRNNNSTNFNNSQNGNIYSVNSSNISINNYNIYDKVLLTPQNRYIPTLPKIIITASASVSDASGKKLNYSLGNVLGQTIKIAPLTYDEYKEEDVALDPFFLDVPKIRQKIANQE